MNAFKKRFMVLCLLVLVISPVWTGAAEPLAAQPPAIHDSAEVLTAKPPEPSQQSEPELPQLIHEETEEEQIAQGISLMQFTRFDTNGWLEGASLTVDLAEPSVKTNLLTPPHVAQSMPLSQQMKATGAIAGVNGDFFDIGNTQAALGAEVRSGELRKSGEDRLAASVSQDRIGQISPLVLQGKVMANGETTTLHVINAPQLPADHLAMYTPDWGTAKRTHLVSPDFFEVLVEDGKVKMTYAGEVHNEALHEGQFILSGKGASAAFLKALPVGSAVEVRVETRPDFRKLAFAIGGGALLVDQGKVVTKDHGAVHPRTAVGFTKDGKKMILATIDGRSSRSRGMTLLELAQWMKEKGAWTALNLDGGGSSTLVARMQGQTGLKVVNTPSDGHERPVPNGIGVWNDKRTGQLGGFKIESGSLRVFSGLTRKFHAMAYDTAYAPLQTDQIRMHWRALPSALGRFDGAVLRAAHPGKGRISVRSRGVESTAEVHVLGKPVSLAIEPRLMGLEKGKTATFLVTGKDASGYQTYVEPEDVQLSYDRQIIDVKANADGSLTVVPQVEQGVTRITARVGNLQAVAGVSIGWEQQRIETFEDASRPWTFAKAPAETTGELQYVDDAERKSKALKLTYDFTKSTKTRAVYALPPTGLMPLPGEVKKIGVHVRGDGGNGHWLRTRIKDAAGVYHTLDLAAEVNWHGWRYVETDVPAGVQYPIQLNQIYLVEPDAKKQDKGDILLDDVIVYVSAPLHLPDEPVQPHPMVLQQETMPQSGWRFAVLNDLHIVSADPDSKEVKHTVQVLRDLSREDVDFVIFNGDLVDDASLENVTFVKTLIEQNLDKPYYVIPGNHETYGTGNLDLFVQVFGSKAALHHFDHKGVRFILSNTALGGWRVSDDAQWRQLDAWLEQGKRDRKVRQLVFLAHHPLNDPNPSKTSQISDAREAGLLQKKLTDFSERSGKPVIMIAAHAHVHHWTQRDGVAYAVVGPVGKRVYGSPDRGGFYGYGVFSINGEKKGNVDKRPWLVADVRPILEDIALERTEFSVNETAEVKVSGLQTGGWSFPLSYPATVRYRGENGLTVTRLDQAKGSSIAVFDPVTHLLRFKRPGKVVLVVQSGGISKRFVLVGTRANSGGK
ncbi:3',5'-cyclic AMP phosphodiesterase CpdA [Laceyella sacchari]|uniref:phosphodiester glycosidase family protein n=1 Tax=Laceyella sacchari TaxID=37482 RepID=UPI00104C6242|nr:phosphodiester glycosidase family protein [Laceyella sacchari]TCW34978.1 3',5'-cyclic AMP phosphodiesterase CpdA [Laceyella sacchari]